MLFLAPFFTLSASPIIGRIIDHLGEHNADGFNIKQFKRDPTCLTSMAVDYCKCVHHDTTKALNIYLATTDQPDQSIQNIIIAGMHNPLLLTLLFWCMDSHPSELARANRFLNAAGVTSTQRILAQELKRQFNEHPGSIDIQPIIKIGKKLDAVELPTPFETYGQ